MHEHFAYLLGTENDLFRRDLEVIVVVEERVAVARFGRAEGIGIDREFASLNSGVLLLGVVVEGEVGPLLARLSCAELAAGIC